MNLGHPTSSVIPGAKGVVLAILARTEQPLTQTAMAGLSNGRVSQQGAGLALRDLVADGIVHQSSAGRSELYLLNRDHVAAAAIVTLAQLRDVLIERIRDLVEAWEVPAVAVWLFGSAARGDGDSKSDIDLFALRRDAVPHDDLGSERTWSDQMVELATSVRAWAGNRCDILDYQQSEFDQLCDQGDPLVASLRAEALTVVGRAPRVMMSGTRP